MNICKEISRYLLSDLLFWTDYFHCGRCGDTKYYVRVYLQILHNDNNLTHPIFHVIHSSPSGHWDHGLHVMAMKTIFARACTALWVDELSPLGCL